MATKLENTLLKNQGFLKLAPDKKEVILDLARRFQQSEDYLYATPDELEEETNVSSKLWEMFLDIETVRLYIKNRLMKLTEIAHRRAMKSLAVEAGRGNVQAAKELNNMVNSSNGENRTVVVLTCVPRPQIKESAQ